MRPAITSSSAACTNASFSASSAEVASSSSKTGASARIGARDGETLALAAGQRDSSLPELRVVALRQGGDEVVRLGAPRRGLDFPTGRVFGAP